ncbi:TPA: aminoacyl-tRNA hydrolase [Candidatus Nomurabacteria bacterium]|nr:MAG: Peptidyl-tRNA hydrolase [Parcubacteria bacterium RAAC4_OD1_1]HCY26448.1 aminoacyl-tRNA hydrolase [Candidatus Nomurabacteria bacterium]
MIYVFGLGNPGKEYEDTRHNTGRIILNHIAKMNDFSDWKNDIGLKALRSKGEIDGEKFDFINPETFMNNSGLSVSKIIDNSKKLKNLVVIYDDIDLPFGSIKISWNRSSGGHNGLESVIKKVKSQEFIRIRVGVCPVTPTGKTRKPKGEEAVVKFLLGKFKEEEIKELKKISKKMSEILVSFALYGKDKTMSEFN